MVSVERVASPTAQRRVRDIGDRVRDVPRRRSSAHVRLLAALGLVSGIAAFGAKLDFRTSVMARRILSTSLSPLLLRAASTALSFRMPVKCWPDPEP